MNQARSSLSLVSINHGSKPTLLAGNGMIRHPRRNPVIQQISDAHHLPGLANYSPTQGKGKVS